MKKDHVGEVAKRMGISTRTVRYYEELGLISSERTSTGYRLFSPAQIEKLKTILSLREVGMPLDDIKQMLHARQHGVTGSKATPQLVEFLQVKIVETKSALKKNQVLLNELESAIKIVENCKECNNTTEETACEECVDKRTNHHIPPLMKSLL